MKFNQPGQWPSSPWYSEEARQQAPADARWMGMEWPTAPVEQPLQLAVDDHGSSLWTLHPMWRDPLSVYMVLQVFWSALEYAQQHPQDTVTWRMTYDVTGPEDDPSPTPAWVIVRAEGPEGSRNLIPSGYDAEFLAAGLDALGVSPYKGPIQKGIPMEVDGFSSATLETCLGKAYATWWSQQRLEQVVDHAPNRPSKIRM